LLWAIAAAAAAQGADASDSTQQAAAAAYSTSFTALPAAATTAAATSRLCTVRSALWTAVAAFQIASATVTTQSAAAAAADAAAAAAASAVAAATSAAAPPSISRLLCCAAGHAALTDAAAAGGTQVGMPWPRCWADQGQVHGLQGRAAALEDPVDLHRAWKCWEGCSCCAGTMGGSWMHSKKPAHAACLHLSQSDGSTLMMSGINACEQELPHSAHKARGAKHPLAPFVDPLQCPSEHPRRMTAAQFGTAAPACIHAGHVLEVHPLLAAAVWPIAVFSGTSRGTVKARLS